MISTPHWTQAVHHDGSLCYVSNMLPKLGEVVQITLRTPIDNPINRVFLRTRPDGESHLTEMSEIKRDSRSIWWQVDLPITMKRNAYRFKLLTDEGAYWYNAYGMSRAQSPDYFDFMLLADFHVPEWIREQVFYQIFPERFANGDPSNDVQDGEYDRKGHKTIKREWGEMPYSWEKGHSVDFFGGDLQGIQQKLDYLADLGISALYLCPIFTAQSNHKYDILDFYNVDPHFGGNEALVELRESMRQKDMHLMLDVTPNHLSFQHPWFLEADEDENAPTTGYFAKDDTGQWETWLGHPSLIKLNYASQKLRDVMYRQSDSILQHWLNPPYSIDAWRLDVANMTGNLRENQLDHDVHREMRESLKTNYPDSYIIGEHFYDGTPHLQGDELDASMNYAGFNIPARRWLAGVDVGVEFDRPDADPLPMATEAMAQQWINFLGAIPFVIALQQFNQLGSHDTRRILTITDGDKALVKLGVALLMNYVGIPCLYYGDEIGMEGGRDPDNRRCMLWDENDWDKDLRDYHQKVIAIRKSSPALKRGGFQLLYAEGDIIVFQRQSPEQRLIFIGYRGDETLSNVEIPIWHSGLEDGSELQDLLSDTTITVENGKITLLQLEHGQAMLLEAKS